MFPVPSSWESFRLSSILFRRASVKSVRPSKVGGHLWHISAFFASAVVSKMTWTCPFSEGNSGLLFACVTATHPYHVVVHPWFHDSGFVANDYSITVSMIQTAGFKSNWPPIVPCKIRRHGGNAARSAAQERPIWAEESHSQVFTDWISGRCVNGLGTLSQHISSFKTSSLDLPWISQT